MGLHAVIDKGHAGGATAQGLQPQRTGAGKKVQHAGAGYGIIIAAVDQQVEDRLTDAVRGGAQVGGGVARAHIGQKKAASCAADDPHAFRSAFRSGVSAMTLGAGLLPDSISRLPTI